MKHERPYLLTFALLISSLCFTLLGFYWNQTYYHESEDFSFEKPTLVAAMQGLHDGLYTQLSEPVIALLAQNGGRIPDTAKAADKPRRDYSQAILAQRGNDINQAVANYQAKQQAREAEKNAKPLSFTTATDAYFQDAVFIGDSRTVGISEYSGIANATFLCKTSLSIYDYDKPKITYEDKKTSVREVLSKRRFGKVYLMVGINECGVGTPQSFYQKYKEVVSSIRELQPDALIFIQGNLWVTQEKSESEQSITNVNIQERNDLIATLANQKDIFYIDINESSLCKDGALVADYTWDQVHIKAQYYSVWKDFLLEHAIIRDGIPSSEMG